MLNDYNIVIAHKYDESYGRRDPASQQVWHEKDLFLLKDQRCKAQDLINTGGGDVGARCSNET